MEGAVHTLPQILSSLRWELSAWAAILIAAEVITLITVPSVLLSRRRQPLAGISWNLVPTSAGQPLLESALNPFSPLL
jgi:hypothetical protein